MTNQQKTQTSKGREIEKIIKEHGHCCSRICMGHKRLKEAISSLLDQRDKEIVEMVDEKRKEYKTSVNFAMQQNDDYMEDIFLRKIETLDDLLQNLRASDSSGEE